MNRIMVSGLVASVASFASVSAATEPPSMDAGPWRAWLETPGGDLPFGLVFEGGGEAMKAWIVNGPERIEIPKVSSSAPGEIVLEITHYESAISAKVTVGKRMDGEWRKRTGRDSWCKLPFRAEAAKTERFSRKNGPGASGDTGSVVEGKWEVVFGSRKDVSVGTFKRDTNDELVGTILTSGGDYGFLAGIVDGDVLWLSNFDGAHALLFKATVLPDGTLKGDFWSRDSFHDTWTAKKNPEAKLAEDPKLAHVRSRLRFSEMNFRDVEGEQHSLAELKFAGRLKIIEVFGTWCPNCHDAAELLAELDKKYRADGLKVIGVAFELTGEFARDAEQVRRFAERHKVEYPLLIGGTNEKGAATAAIPIGEEIAAYPTTIFVDSDRNIVFVHSGFAGPATGPEHDALRRKFQDLIEGALYDRRRTKEKG
ncbi:MAG: TlpA disulfide reductase family protein [Planctomycetota bacterium]